MSVPVPEADEPYWTDDESYYFADPEVCFLGCLMHSTAPEVLALAELVTVEDLADWRVRSAVSVAYALASRGIAPDAQQIAWHAHSEAVHVSTTAHHRFDKFLTDVFTDNRMAHRQPTVWGARILVERTKRLRVAYAQEEAQYASRSTRDFLKRREAAKHAAVSEVENRLSRLTQGFRLA